MMINKLIGFLYSIFVRAVSVLPQSARPHLYYLPWRVCGVFFYASMKRTSKKNNKSPTNQMLESRKFYSANMGRVNNVASLLGDDTSRDCYYKMIDFRCNSDWTNFPQVSRIQYFDDEYFTYNDSEIYVDCGAYNGDTIIQFKNAIKKHGGNFAKIVAFEPGEKYDILTSAHKDVIAIKAGVWSQDDMLMFSDDGSATRIAKEIPWEGGTISIPVRGIDSCPECEGVTLLKMDIEGAEMDALIGAKNTIATYKPKLAICIYHSDEDMIRIAEWIHEHFPEYRLFVRQHVKYSIGETVLYGFIE